MNFRHPVIRYGGALLVTAIAYAAWFAFPAVHHNPFMLFLAAVVVSTRFLGFGPGIFATFASLFVIDYAVLPPVLAISRSSLALQQLAVFLAIALLTVGIARQRSRAEDRASEAQRRMAAIVETSQDAILSKDVNGVITSWNQGAERLYGYRAEEVIGKSVAIIAPPEHPDEIRRLMEKLLRGERIQHYQAERVRKDGSRVIVYLSISPIFNRKGEIIGASTIAHDMTAQQRTEEALRKNEKLATAGRLAATIAHEINNPLEAIGNLIYLAQRDKTRSDEYLGMAEKEVQRVASIARQTLGFVRDAASTSNVEVAKIVDEVLTLFQNKLSAKKIQLEKSCEPSAQILGFSGELRQLFSNLIANALDATPDGGKLWIRVEPCHEWSNSMRPGVKVTVADTGEGITPENAKHLFEPFFTTKKDSGTGLGLWLSYSIVQKHGGSIRFRSRTTPGRSGTVFSIFLPQNPEMRQSPTLLQPVSKSV